MSARIFMLSVNAGENPEKVLNSVNRLLYENTDANAYATLFFAEIDHCCGSVRYANCGHLSGLLLRRDGGAVERLPSTCTALGMFEDWQCSMGHAQIDPGDTLALYTDGLTETFNASGEEFGEERLVDALRRYRNRNAKEVAGAIVDEVTRFSGREQYDDITLIIARRVG